MLKRYEQSTRVVTAFYAVLLGFGLKRLLDNPSLEGNRWFYLILASLFFLRFLIGSANHLWFEYVSRDPVRINEKRLLFDVFFLIVFGVIGLVICYEADAKGFLQWNCWLGVVGTIGALVYWGRGRRDGTSGDWSFWVWINLAQTALAFLALIVHWSYAVPPKLPWWPVDGSLALLSLAYLALLLTDVHKQLTVLATAPKS